VQLFCASRQPARHRRSAPGRVVLLAHCPVSLDERFHPIHQSVRFMPIQLTDNFCVLGSATVPDHAIACRVSRGRSTLVLFRLSPQSASRRLIFDNQPDRHGSFFRPHFSDFVFPPPSSQPNVPPRQIPLPVSSFRGAHAPRV
jgi:hypothetical protein